MKDLPPRPDLRGRFPVVFMFSGQGSHYFQMAAAFYREDATFRRHLEHLDAKAAALMGASVVEYLYQPAKTLRDAFTLTRFSHPGIYMIECALANTLADAGVVADLLMGSSMGTFVAAAIAGCLDQEQALAVVIEQARLLERHCVPGAMLAVLAPPSLFDESPQLNARTELAGVNMPGHFVVTGREQDIADARRFLDGKGVINQQLNVSYAFHSSHIHGLRPHFLAALRHITLRPGRLPVVCSAQARTVSSFSHEDLWNIAVKPIRFRESVAMLEAAGACHYIDLGPSGTLATFVKYCLSRDSRSTTHTILTPFGNEAPNLRAVIDRFGAAPADQYPCRVS